MSFRFDAALKEIVGHNVADFRTAFPLPTIEPAQTLNVDLSTLSAATDVALGFGSPMREIADLNFQSGPDADVAARLHLYNAALYQKFLVPVHSILILLRAKADVANLTEKLSYSCGGKRVEFEYSVVRMWKREVKEFLGGGIGLLPLATLCRLPTGKRLVGALHEVVQEINRRLEKLPNTAEAKQLMTATAILCGMRIDSKHLGTVFEGATIMHETTAFDYFMEMGEKRGEERGVQRGKQEGAIEHGQQLVLRLGEQKLGAPTAKTKEKLFTITDLARLDRMASALFSATTWRELLSTP